MTKKVVLLFVKLNSKTIALSIKLRIIIITDIDIIFNKYYYKVSCKSNIQKQFRTEPTNKVNILYSHKISYLKNYNIITYSISLCYILLYYTTLFDHYAKLK